MQTSRARSSADVLFEVEGSNFDVLSCRKSAFTFGSSCPFCLCSYTYWWTPEVIKHLPLPYDEGEYLLLS